MAVKWIAFCSDCNKELEKCKNGVWADSAANRHLENNPDHFVLVGYQVKVKNDALILAEGMAKDLE